MRGRFSWVGGVSAGLVLCLALLLAACGGGGGGRGSAGADPLAERGEQLFDQYGCAACHSVKGESGIGPALNGIFGKEVQLEDGTTLVVDDAYLRESIIDPDAKIVKGYPKGSMAAGIAAYKTELEKEENLEALVAYIKNLK